MKALTLIEWKLLQWMSKPFNGNPSPMYYPCFNIYPDGIPSFSNEGRNFTKDACKAALTFIERGWIWIDEYKNHRLNDAGLQAAKETPKPAWNPPKPPKLEERDYQVLAELGYATRGGAFVSPLDCGGYNGSHHSASLTKLTHHGYAECRKTGGIVTGSAIVPEPRLTKRAKGSRYFRITAEGKKVLAERQS